MKLTLSSTQFSQLIMCMLYDFLLRPDEIVPILKNQDYNDLMTILKHRSLRTILQQYYMQLDPQMRIRYRMMQEVFRDNTKTQSVFIEIKKEHLNKQEKSKGIIRRTGEFFQKVLNLKGFGG